MFFALSDLLGQHLPIAKRYLRFYAVPDVHFHFLVWNRSCLEAYAQSIEQLQENSFADLTT